MSANNAAIGFGIFLASGALLAVRSYLLKKKEEGLTEKKIQLIQASWKKVEAIGVEAVGVLLFKNIFTAAPGALALFSFKDEKNLYESAKLKAHGKIVVQTVGTAVAGLRDLGALVPVLTKLGKVHGEMGKGINKSHYDLVGAQLIATLRMGLGKEFTPEVESAWIQVYSVVADTMLAGQ